LKGARHGTMALQQFIQSDRPPSLELEPKRPEAPDATIGFSGLQINCDRPGCPSALIVPPVANESTRRFALRVRAYVDSYGWVENGKGADICRTCATSKGGHGIGRRERLRRPWSKSRAHRLVEPTGK
jgi:hypothetical protein